MLIYCRLFLPLIGHEQLLAGWPVGLPAAQPRAHATDLEGLN
jgi:hypothetical protein